MLIPDVVSQLEGTLVSERRIIPAKRFVIGCFRPLMGARCLII